MNLVKLEEYETIYCVDTFQEDFDEIVKNQKRYYKWLTRSLKQLEEFGTKVFNLPNFEKLKGVTPNLYSIRYDKSTINLRILYFYEEDAKILLIPFKEKNKNDYIKNIEIAKNMIKQLQE